MAFQPWEYRTETASNGYAVDLTGYSVAAIDGDIGHVDEATSELVGSSYLVVDTAARIVGRKVLLPAGVVEWIDPSSTRSTSTGPKTKSRTRPSTTIGFE
jgi:hypothetical protein